MLYQQGVTISFQGSYPSLILTKEAQSIDVKMGALCGKIANISLK